MKQKCYIGFDIKFKIYKDQYPMKSYDTPSLYIHTIYLFKSGSPIAEAPIYIKAYPIWSVFGVWTESYFKESYPYHYEINEASYKEIISIPPKKIFSLKKESANNLFMKYFYNMFEDMPELLI